MLLWDGWQKVILGLLFSTFLGFGGGIALMTLIARLTGDSKPGKVRRTFGRLQIVSAAFMAVARNEAQVVNYLATKAGVAKNRMVPKGYGERKPIDTNRTASGRAKNRRVQFVILDPSQENCQQ